MPPQVRVLFARAALVGVCGVFAAGCVSGRHEVPEPPGFAYCLWHRRDVQNAENIFCGLQGTPCDAVFVCPMYNLSRWNGSEIRPAPRRHGLQPEEIEPLVRRARELGFAVVLQPNLTIDPSVEPEMLPNYNPWWQQFAHPSEATWRGWTEILEEHAAIAERSGAEYLVCLHEADVLLIFPGWRDFIQGRLRKIAPSVKLIYSQHAMQHLRLSYSRRLNAALWAVRLTRTRGDRALAAADIFEMVGAATLSPSFKLPADVPRRRQLGTDLLKAWVMYRPPKCAPWCHPYLDLVREEFDAYKSSDYWPLVYDGKDRAGMAAIYHEYRFVSDQRVLGWRPKHTVRFSEAQRRTRRLFGPRKPWFRETGLEALPKGADYAELCLPFVQATQDAWTGFTDCIVWWGNGYDRAFIAAMQTLSLERR